ncbi:MAG: hypothetical protein SFU87_17070, partial [Chitinophagaceae bacterium]|nr:hypothetical protein [Chitinophagaceae bacterium]
MKIIIIAFLMILSCSYAGAQQAFTNSGNFQIHTGASVAGFGDFTNTSAASLLNNGNFYLKRTVTNSQASMTTGTGTLYLNGTAAQSVAGTQPFKTYNLVTDNTSGITLNNDLTVAAVHTF